MQPLVPSLALLLTLPTGCTSDSPQAPAGPSAQTTESAQADEPTPVVLNEVIEPYTSCDADDVCTVNSISGCTEPGLRFVDRGDCDAVQTQRPIGIGSSGAGLSQTEHDPERLQDPDFQWVTEQVEACGCVCCHSTELDASQAYAWDIDYAPVWTESVTDRGLGIFAGIVPSSALGYSPVEENNGFSRELTGAPTTDVERFQQFFFRELERRNADLRDVRVAGSSERIDAGAFGDAANNNDGGVAESE